MIDLSKALGIVQDIATLAKRIADSSAEVEVDKVAINLQSTVLDLQSEMLKIQADYHNLLRTKDDLKKKLVEYEDWHNAKACYSLKQVGEDVHGDGVGIAFVYVLNPEHAADQPVHWLCARCFEDKKKSILQAMSPYRWNCPRCDKSLYVICPVDVE